MGKKYRDLSTNRLAEPFAREILGFTDSASLQKAINSIIKAEGGIDQATSYPTITHRDCRDISYVEEEKRLDLREKIFGELVLQKRLKNEDDICLGAGGALPLKRVSRKSQFYYWATSFRQIIFSK